jgi:hypothetical protein
MVSDQRLEMGCRGTVGRKRLPSGIVVMQWGKGGDGRGFKVDRACY